MPILRLAPSVVSVHEVGMGVHLEQVGEFTVKKTCQRTFAVTTDADRRATATVTISC
jgi:hypothetical protein